jgi:hypothetical protein
MEPNCEGKAFHALFFNAERKLRPFGRARRAAKMGVMVTFDDAVLNRNLYGLGIMKSPNHSGSLALQPMEVQISN